MFSNAKPHKKKITMGQILLHATLVWSVHSGASFAADIDVVMNSNQVVPAQSGAGTGTGTITVDKYGWVSGSVSTLGMAGTAGSIREAAMGKNGRLVVVLAKYADTYTVPAGTMLDRSQFASYILGNLYVNVETVVNPDGEVRGQIVLPLFH